MEGGAYFSGIGDANPENVGKHIVKHLIRMAETRAKARALRDAINIGVTAYEELDAAEPSASNHPSQSVDEREELLQKISAYAEAIYDDKAAFEQDWTKGVDYTKAKTSSLRTLWARIAEEGGDDVDINSIPGVSRGVSSQGGT